MTKRPAPYLKAMMAAVDLPDGAEVPEWVQLLPSGDVIKTYDGRGPWRVKDAEAVIAASMADARFLVIDENHNTDKTAETGGEAPARGWIKELQARADGIWGRIDWTQTGKALLTDRAYRGISPVFLYTEDGVVRQILRASLTNNPNLRELTALNTELPMNWAKIAKALGLAEDADEAAIIAKISAMMEKKADPDMKAMQASLTAIGTALGVKDGDAAAIEVAARLAAGGKDSLATLQAENSALSARVTTMETDSKKALSTAYIDGEIAKGRMGLNAANRDKMIADHMAQPEMTQRWIEGMLVNKTTHTADLPPALAEDTLKAMNAEQQGVELAGRARAYMAKQTAAGTPIDYIAAVTAVSEGKK